ncbi:hypothetical protein [Streptomyces sp. NPDC059786]|uniref:hypothetical protein n=1 Tax=Streptomyces sp. NPDC059786 TaxID=3346946 RepID=UPI00364B43D1
MPRMPRWSATWPTRPEGVYTVLVRATDPTDAVRIASEEVMPLTDGYALAFDYEPQVWRLLRPYRLRSHPVAGPSYPEDVPFVPEPLDLKAVAEEAMSAVRLGDALGKSEDEIRTAVGQTLGLLTPTQVVEAFAVVRAETREINSYTSGEF